MIFGYQKSDRIDFCVVFWDTKQNKKNIKQVKNLIQIKSFGDYCCIIYKESEVASIILGPVPDLAVQRTGFDRGQQDGEHLPEERGDE